MGDDDGCDCNGDGVAGDACSACTCKSLMQEPTKSKA